MHFIECCTHRFAALTATSVRTDVVPVFGRVVSRAHETIIERLIKCLDRIANGCLSVVAQCRARQHQEQTNNDDADRLHGTSLYLRRLSIVSPLVGEKSP